MRVFPFTGDTRRQTGMSRNPSTHVTRLEDTRTTTGGPSYPYDPIRVIEIPAGITGATVLDGFTISIAPFDSGASQPSATAIFIDDSSPIISNNVITSPDLSVGTTSNTIGISHVTGGNPEIHHNTITLGTRDGAATNSSNYGIYGYSGAAPNIHDNTINAGASTGTGGKSYGIYLNNCAGTVENNPIINGGTAEEEATGVYLYTSTTSVRNNGLITSKTTGTASKFAFGVRLESQSHATIENNSISGFSANSVRCVMVSSQSRPSIFSNYIDAGNNTTNVGIVVNNEDPGTTLFTEIHNNVINAGTGVSTTGIFVYSKETRLNIFNNTINGGGGGTFAMVSRYEETRLRDPTLSLISRTITFLPNLHRQTISASMNTIMWFPTPIWFPTTIYSIATLFILITLMEWQTSPSRIFWY